MNSYNAHARKGDVEQASMWARALQSLGARRTLRIVLERVAAMLQQHGNGLRAARSDSIVQGAAAALLAHKMSRIRTLSQQLHVRTPRQHAQISDIRTSCGRHGWVLASDAIQLCMCGAPTRARARCTRSIAAQRKRSFTGFSLSVLCCREASRSGRTDRAALPGTCAVHNLRAVNARAPAEGTHQLCGCVIAALHRDAQRRETVRILPLELRIYGGPVAQHVGVRRERVQQILHHAERVSALCQQR